ncbi:hypothetical protein P8452_73791 [Trifolium repens]|nr:hypothetical protein P8452_73791 [Trifolium repens]
MRTIIIQSDMRANDPVGGCYKYIQDLQAQIEYYKTELDLVLQQLAVFRAQSNDHHHQQQQVVNYGDQVIMNSDSLLGYYNPSGSVVPATTPAHYHYNVQQQVVTPLQNMNKNNTLCSNASDEYDHKPTLDIPCDERNELGFESGEILHHSDEAVLFKIDDGLIKAEGGYIQETQAQEQDHDLKGAATLFTLTNCTS